uniref:LMBR1 domain-containing protein 2 n=1 Tax=Angiostrongylus cantonensis TaxID=6313 RepID=A0A0K0CZV9_ANGCA
MGAGPLLIELVAVFVLTSVLLNKYTAWQRHHPTVILSAFIGWCFSFVIIFVLPLDVAITIYNRCEVENARSLNSTDVVSSLCEKPDGYVPNAVLLYLWRIVYWTIVLPFMQSFVNAGDFTVYGKMRAALFQNAVYYGIYLLVFSILLVYAIIKGYGFVEFPRGLWNMGNRDYLLSKTYFNIDKIFSDKNETEEALKDAYREARTVLNVLKNEHGTREKAQMIISRFPEEVIEELFPARSAIEFSSLNASDIRSVNSDTYLIRLHKRVISAVQNHHRTTAQWRSLINKALYLENIAQAEISGHLERSSSFVPENVRYFWLVLAQRPLCKLVSVVLMCMTVFIVISECTFFIVNPTLTPAGIYYHLDPNRHTDANSLLFSAKLLCRLTPPVCLNFLGMIHLDSHITMAKGFGVETQFTRLMGHLDVIPILATGINVYLPICILVFCAATYFRIGTYLLHNLGFDQFVVADEFTQEMVTSGRALVQLERNSFNRKKERLRREEEWSGRLGV